MSTILGTPHIMIGFYVPRDVAIPDRPELSDVILRDTQVMIAVYVDDSLRVERRHFSQFAMGTQQVGVCLHDLTEARRRNGTRVSPKFKNIS